MLTQTFVKLIHQGSSSELNELNQMTDQVLAEKHHKSMKYIKQAILLALWYLFSFFTIVLNKYILTTLGGEASFLGQTQMFMSVIFGGATIYVLPCCLNQRTNSERQRITFFKNMSVLGCLR